MQIDGSVALVTGAGRGLGRVYAWELVSIALDITDAERLARVAEQCADVSLLVNNAGVMMASTFINAPSLDAARLEMETNYFGTLSMCRAFAPVLAAHEAGEIEVLTDERSRFVKASLSRDHELIYPPVQAFWDAMVAGTP